MRRGSVMINILHTSRSHLPIRQEEVVRSDSRRGFSRHITRRILRQRHSEEDGCEEGHPPTVSLRSRFKQRFQHDAFRKSRFPYKDPESDASGNSEKDTCAGPQPTHAECIERRPSPRKSLGGGASITDTTNSSSSVKLCDDKEDNKAVAVVVRELGEVRVTDPRARRADFDRVELRDTVSERFAHENDRFASSVVDEDFVSVQGSVLRTSENRTNAFRSTDFHPTDNRANYDMRATGRGTNDYTMGQYDDDDFHDHPRQQCYAAALPHNAAALPHNATSRGDRVDRKVVNSVNRYAKLAYLQHTERYKHGPQPEEPGLLLCEPLFTSKGTPVNLCRFYKPDVWPGPLRFERIHRLSKAIHGEVCLYYDRYKSEKIVIKRISNKVIKGRSPGYLENPLAEIGAMSYLFSERAVAPVDLVAALKGLYLDSEYTYLATEYCEGGELFPEVVRRHGLREINCKAIALQTALALDSLHQNGICHRDVSLENIVLCADRTVRLIDFGQAEALYDIDGNPKLLSGAAGKAYYRAPEMLRGEYYGAPADVFALGVMIFIMAIGSPPWNRAYRQDPRYRNLTRTQTALDLALCKWAKRQDVSDALVDLLANIFCSNTKSRPTIRQMLCHPWFCFDQKVWSWIDSRNISVTIRAHARRVEEYLKVHPSGNCFDDASICSTDSEKDSHRAFRREEYSVDDEDYLEH